MIVYWIEEFENGVLGTMPKPKGGEWLESEIEYLAQERVNLVVSLLEKEEANLLGLRLEGSLCHKHDIDFISFPIEDYSFPHDDKAFLKLADLLLEKLTAGERVVVHCHGGIGRSSMLAASVLIKNGTDKEKVFEVISEYRTVQVPDTEAQIQWVLERF